MQFLNLSEYEALRAKYQDLRMSFREEIGSKRRCLVTKAGTRTYLKGKDEDVLLLGMNEINLISRVSKSCKNAVDNGIHAPFNKNKCVYMCYSEKLKNSVIYEDIVQIDINAAYLTAARNRGYISKSIYNKFFEIEDNEKRLKDKANLKDEHLKQYITKDGEILKYSKKSRLISLGMLAERKRIDYYSGYSKKTNSFNQYTGRMRTETTPTHSGRSEVFETKETYNENYANVFFTCAYDVDKCLFNCMDKIEGVFFYWVDAIFCTKNAANEVIEMMKNYGFECKVKEHNFLQKIGFDIFVHDEKKAKKYSFSKFKRFDNVNFIREIEKDFDSILEDLESLTELSEKEQLKTLANYYSFDEKEVLRFCKNKGYSPINYLIFWELCEVLEIESVDDFNINFLTMALNKKGLTLKEFTNVSGVEIKDINKDNLNTLNSVFSFFEAQKRNSKERKKDNDKWSEAASNKGTIDFLLNE